ncbi:MAG: archaeal DNA polymerase II, large subunit [Candidatus Nanosalina sp. J07AB43]|nr:MAG: archaeal DNA polymerase II, large subunit [Candidatus Nanosalina sp. J07AB43]
MKRYATEVEDYYNRVTAKQYNPTREETKKIASNVPIEVTGSPTEDLDVSNYKDLDRVETNKIRGGMCLVYLDGLPLKASKIKKRIKKWGDEFGLEHWGWIKDYLELQKEIHSSGDDEDEDSEEESKDQYTPSDKYLGSLTAGRPVFAHPGEKGGFRLRYGHSRTNGLAAVSFHPATMEITERFLAIGTQMKMEYPGKATVGTPCDSIHPPVVRLESGDVLKVETREKAREIEEKVEEILFLGDVLVPYGEFVENGKKLLPSPYVEEWWEKEMNKALEEQDVKLGKNFDGKTPTPEEAFKISDALDIPLHPRWQYHWKETTPEKFKALVKELSNGKITSAKAKECLEDILVEHKQDGNQVKVKSEDLKVLQRLLQDKDRLREGLKEINDSEAIQELVSDVSGYMHMDQAPHYIGGRMGRPEKAEKRTLNGDPQLLFPCGKEEGGRMRNVSAAYNQTMHGEQGIVEESIIHNRCPECGEITYYSFCRECNVSADEIWFCTDCGKELDHEPDSCPSCGNERFRRYKQTEIDVESMLDKSMKNVGVNKPPELLKSFRGMTSEHKHVEPIEKGLLREKYGLYVNKDATVRYDASDLPMTHFKPREIDVSVEKLRDIGYKEDHKGRKLQREDQILELKPQDIIIPDSDKTLSAANYMIKVCDFVDDLLENFYDLPPFYEVEDKGDLVGELVIGLAPHTSGGTVGRIIGFTEAKGIYAHPYWHAGKRRNADGDEDAILMMMDGLLNFSRQFLPDMTGARTMDAPLILSTVLNPDEVDDEAWAVETVDEYPLGFYEETQDYKEPWELDNEIQIGEDIVHSDNPFQHGFTHDSSDVENGPVQSEYVTLDEMSDKTSAQLGLGEKTKAVDEDAVAELLLDKHFIPDIKGNLRSFSSQKMRCVDCNEKFRRVPLTNQTIAPSGKETAQCPECGGKVLLTISEGTIKKYMQPSKDIIESYEISPYKRQEIMILNRTIQSLFGKSNHQSGLKQFT